METRMRECVSEEVPLCESKKETRPKKIAILGGGLAGMAAAVRLLAETDGRLEVHVYEQSRFLGGRLSSFREPRTGKMLDAVQHVSMKCCDATVRFLERTDLAACGAFQEEMVFAAPVDEKNSGGDTRMTFSVLRNSRVLPAPLHLLGSVLRMKFLTFRQRLELISLMGRMRNQRPAEGMTFSGWLDALGCSAAVRRLFWETLTFSAFSDRMENISARLADTVFSRILMGRKDAWHVWVPGMPLREIFHDGVLRFLRRFPAFHFHPQWQVTRVHPDEASGRFTLTFRTAENSGEAVMCADFDACVLAVQWHVAGRVMPELVGRGILEPEMFQPRTISAVHAWYDRPLFGPWENVALPGRVTQWIFRHARADADFPVGDAAESAAENTLEDAADFVTKAGRISAGETCRGFYHQLMLSDAEACCSARPEVLQRVMTAEVAEMFPVARLLHAKTVSVPASVFSPNPEVEWNRPPTRTPWRNVFLAGDWTATGLPATMESAVLSGEAAAEELMRGSEEVKE